MTRITETAAHRPASLRFSRGEGRYVADITVPGALEVFILRSTEAHAAIAEIVTDEALAVPGVRAIVTGAEIAAATEPQPVIWDLPGQRIADTRSLAHEVVRYVGEPVAAIVADDLASARRAAAAVRIRYVTQPVIATIDAALSPGAPKLYPDWPDNIVASMLWEAGDVDAAFAKAAHVVEGDYTSGRVAGLSLETRGVLATPDHQLGGLTIWTSTQAIHQVREFVAHCLRLPEHRIRVVAPDVGGAFGIKACPYGEETLLAYLALKLRRPVRWIEDRREAFTASVAGRDERVSLAAAFDAEGHILGVKARLALDKGAAPYAASIGAAWAGGMTLCGGYRIANLKIESLGVVTNKTPTGAYRGYGVPESNFAMERTLDEAARALHIDPAELRRRNLVPAAEMPYQAPTGLVLDSGRYHEMLDLTLAGFGYEEARQRVAAARRRGRRAGLGLAFYIEPTNMGPSALCGMVGVRTGGFDVCQVRVEPSGQLSVFTGQTPMGQGVEAAIATLCAREFGVPEDDVSVIHGDTQSCAYTGYSSGASRGAGIGGGAALLSLRKVKRKMLALAAHLMETDENELEFSQGGVQHRSDPSRRMSHAQLAKAAYHAWSLPPGMEPGLEERTAFDPPGLGITYGAVLAEVELEPDTDAVRVQRIVFGHDCGVQIRPEIVEGQVVGGIAQGIGTALFEELAYDDNAMPRVTSLRAYEFPLAADMPEIELVHLETPSPFFPHGAKGVGESGVIPLPAAIANAVRDALGELGRPKQVNQLPIRL